MANYLGDDDVTRLLQLARGMPELAAFCDMLDAVSRLCRAAEPLAANLLDARQRAVGYEQQGQRLQAQLREQTGELEIAQAKITALEARVRKFAA